jgi:nucleoside 2-deoxyribosyltransferase
MKVYLAHNFKAREWLPEVIERLKQAGIECTSTWITDDAHTKGGSHRESALVDLDDIDRSDCLVLFVDNYGYRPGKGKYFEMGYAFAQGLRVIIIGEDNSCVFYSLAQVERVKDVDELLEVLSG